MIANNKNLFARFARNFKVTLRSIWRKCCAGWWLTSNCTKNECNWKIRPKKVSANRSAAHFCWERERERRSFFHGRARARAALNFPQTSASASGARKISERLILWQESTCSENSFFILADFSIFNIVIAVCSKKWIFRFFEWKFLDQLHIFRISHKRGNSTHVVTVLSNPNEALLAPFASQRILYSPIFLLVICDTIAHDERSIIKIKGVAFWIRIYTYKGKSQIISNKCLF